MHDRSQASGPLAVNRHTRHDLRLQPRPGSKEQQPFVASGSHRLGPGRCSSRRNSGRCRCMKHSAWQQDTVAGQRR